MHPSEWLEIFPTAKTDYILPRLQELNQLIPRREETIKRKMKALVGSRDDWFLRELVKAFDLPDLIHMKDQQSRLRRYLPQNKEKSSKGVSQDQIDRAKDYSIVDLAERCIPSMRRRGATYSALCLFHEEKTPSFYLYPRGNNFHCFGCGAHGDVIALTQKLLSCGFIAAVRHLAP